MRKRLLATLLVLCVAVAMLPGKALAGEQTVVYASTTAELLKAVSNPAAKSNTKVILEEKEYKLERTLSIWNETQSMSNITIQGTGNTRIVVPVGYAAVISINKGKNITLDGLILGHDIPVEQGCTTGVLDISFSTGITIINCDIFGCGLYGIYSYASDVSIKDSVIRDCSSQIACSWEKGNLCFTNCCFSGNGYTYSGAAIGMVDDSTATFTKCTFVNNPSTRLDNSDGKFCAYNNCVFYGNGWGNDNVSSPPDTSEMPAATLTQPVTSEKPATSTGFTDVADDAWYREAIEFVSKPANNSVDYGLMDASASTTFSPNSNADRATIVTALYRKSGDGYELGNNPNQKFPYSDISREILPIVYWANDCNITTGYGDGRFGPNDPVTREQFAVFLYRYAQEKYSRTHNDDKYELSARADLSVYTDSSKISSWATEAMSWANARGFITGVTDTTLNPSAYVTRAEVATILMRAAVI